VLAMSNCAWFDSHLLLSYFGLRNALCHLDSTKSVERSFASWKISPLRSKWQKGKTQFQNPIFLFIRCQPHNPFSVGMAYFNFHFSRVEFMSEKMTFGWLYTHNFASRGKLDSFLRRFVCFQFHDSIYKLLHRLSVRVTKPVSVTLIGHVTGRP